MTLVISVICDAVEHGERCKKGIMTEVGDGAGKRVALPPGWSRVGPRHYCAFHTATGIAMDSSSSDEESNA